MAEWQIAQMNVGTALYDLDDARMAGFMERLDDINALADASPGFVWRLQTEAGNNTDLKLTENPRFIVNMSVWQSIEALADFAYRSEHRQVMVQRRQWFEHPSEAYQVLWWVPAGAPPTPEEGLRRLARLNAEGPGPEAFDFTHRFPPPA